MSRQYDDATAGRFDLYGTEYEIVYPENTEDLAKAVSVKSALETHISGLMHDEDSSGYESLLQEQNDCIDEYINSLGEFDNTHLISNINYFLKKHGMRIGELEQLIGVSAGYISRTAKPNSAKKLSIDVVWKLAKLFGVDIRTLIYTDMKIPNSNAVMAAQFLGKLCEQTEENEIKWENLGGSTYYPDEKLLRTGLITEEDDGTIIYHAEDHMNPSLRFVLTEDVYICKSIAKGKSFAIIGFAKEGNEETQYYDFVFLSRSRKDINEGHLWEKAFYASDDRFHIIDGQAATLSRCIISQELDAQISPEVRNIISDYLK